MKTQHFLGIIGIAIVLSFAIVGFLGSPAFAESTTLPRGSNFAFSEDVHDCPLADSGSCPLAASETCPMANGDLDDCPALNGGNCPLADSGVCPMADDHDNFDGGCPMRMLD